MEDVRRGVLIDIGECAEIDKTTCPDAIRAVLCDTEEFARDAGHVGDVECIVKQALPEGAEHYGYGTLSNLHYAQRFDEEFERRYPGDGRPRVVRVLD